jgi:hypothetical protein
MKKCTFFHSETPFRPPVNSGKPEGGEQVKKILKN